VKSLKTPEVIGLCVAFAIAMTVGAVGMSKTKSPVVLFVILFFFVLGIAVVMGLRYLTTVAKAKADLAAHKKYRELADEYRRLADMAITTQEHTDLKLGDVTVQMDFLRAELESMQRILKDVE
jgi:hypothetical protein